MLRQVQVFFRFLKLFEHTPPDGEGPYEKYTRGSRSRVHDIVQHVHNSGKWNETVGQKHARIARHYAHGPACLRMCVGACVRLYVCLLECVHLSPSVGPERKAMPWDCDCAGLTSLRVLHEPGCAGELHRESWVCCSKGVQYSEGIISEVTHRGDRSGCDCLAQCRVIGTQNTAWRRPELPVLSKTALQ